MRQVLIYVLRINTYFELNRRRNKFRRLFSFGSEFSISLFKKPFFKAAIEYASKRWQEIGFDYSVATISFDCDLQEDYEALPSVLDMLRRNKIKASFAIIGKWIEIYPDIHKKIIDEGHEIINHTYTHPNNKHFSPNRRMVNLPLQEKKKEITRFHEVCENLLKYSPIGYRAPHLGSSHGMEIYPVLKELGYKYSTSDIALRFGSLGAPLKINDIWEFPLSLSARDIFDTPTTSVVVRDKVVTEKEYYRDIEYLIDASSKPFFFNIYCDPMDVIRMSGFENMLIKLRAQFRMITYEKLVTLLETTDGKN